MKKWKISAIILAAVILFAVIAAGVILLLSSSALTMQADIYENYIKMHENLRTMTLTVTENGEAVGSYNLENLGILEDTKAAVEHHFGPHDRMKPAAFAQVSPIGRLKWRFAEKPPREKLPVVTDHLVLDSVLQDLNAVTRQAPQDAYMEYVDGHFLVNKEVAGTLLAEKKIRALLTDTVKAMAVGTGSSGNTTVELTDHDCYVLPEVTMENGHFDFEGCLDTSLQNLALTVNFHEEQATISNEQIRDMMRVTDDGYVEVDEAAVTELVAQWHQEFRFDGVPYRFNAQVGGVKPIDFLPVDYELNQEETAEAVKTALLSLEQTETDAVWYCWRKGEAFAIEGEYVEIDIPNQKMTYIKDNEVVVCTDVVTGATWGYPTPPGLYKVENKDTNCWLEGEDYNVHVDYWIGFIGYMVGIHDADWRTKFGGTNYVKNGSHGCVNTPKEATATIFEHIEVGVPVLVYGK